MKWFAKGLMAVLVFQGVSCAYAAQDTTLTASGPRGELAGSFLDAGSGKPVVLMIPGSGPTSRDGGASQILRLLAQGLAAHDVSSVRVDKRGMFGSAKAVADANAVTIQDYVSDVQSWVNVIQKKTGQRCVWVAGHSEGALVALVASGSVKPVCGLVLLSTPGRPMGEVLRSQLHAAPGVTPLLPQVDGAIDALESGKTVDVGAFHPSLKALFRPGIQGYWRDIMRYDPARLIAGYGGPVLLVQGGQDHQVLPDQDFDRLKKAAPKAQTLFLPKAAHVLKDLPGNGLEAMREVNTNPFLPLDVDLVPKVAEFISTH